MFIQKRATYLSEFPLRRPQARGWPRSFEPPGEKPRTARTATEKIYGNSFDVMILIYIERVQFVITIIL